MADTRLREALVATACALGAHGLNQGAAGNVSARCAEGFLVTPTGLAAAAMRPTDMVPMALDGHWQGARKPSSEWRCHRDLYVAQPRAGAVVHAHAPFASALACLRQDIPPFHYMIARFGGHSVRCAAYATFGTQALSDAALAALSGRNACLLANHGLLVHGRDLAQALDLALELESLCEQYWRALQIGRPVLLTAAEMDAVLEKFRTYGQQE